MFIDIKREMSWNDIKENSWAGAVPVCEEIEKQGKEDEAMSLIAKVFCDEIPDEWEVNEFIWRNIAKKLHLYEEDEEDKHWTIY